MSAVVVSLADHRPEPEPEAGMITLSDGREVKQEKRTLATAEGIFAEVADRLTRIERRLTALERRTR